MRSLQDPGFPGDDGAPDPIVVAALAAYSADPADTHTATLAVLQQARLLVPVVAVLGRVEYDDSGLARDKTSDMAAVLMTGRDGRTALLAFTGAQALQQWDAQARPVPVRVPAAAAAAVQDKASAIVVDIAGPVLFVIEDHDLTALADGYTLADVAGRFAWIKQDCYP